MSPDVPQPFKSLYVYDGDWPRGATRVRKQTMALADAGHSVRLICRNESRDPRVESEPWMEVRRLPEFPGRLNRFLNFPLFFSPIWVGNIIREIRDHDPHVLIVEDLPLAPAVVILGRLFRIPVVYDMGEVYPEFLRGLAEQTRPSLVDRILRSPSIARGLEWLVLRGADHVVVVSEESRARAETRGADPTTLHIVGNTPENPEALLGTTDRPEDLADFGARSIVLFVGILIHDRGMETLVRALPSVLEGHPDVLFVVVGDGPERQEMERLAVALGVSDQLHFSGWQQHDDLPAYYQVARVGLLPFLPIGQIHFTLANKLFDYLGAGLPVVASDVAPMRRVVTEGDVGRLVEGGSPEALASGILEVLSLPDSEWQGMSERAIRLVHETYSWRHDAERFASAVEMASDPDARADHGGEE